MKNIKQVISIILLIFFSFTMLFSLIKIINWSIDNTNTVKKIEKIKKDTKTEILEDSIYTNIITQSNNIQNKLIQVDFTNLLKQNKEVVGWIKIPETKIDYPFVQTKNNNYYLYHSFDRSWNEAGWIFLDYRNNINELDTNTIIYGHGRLDGTMFGSLRNTTEDKWLSNKENHIVMISSLSYNYLFEVFSIYKIKTTNDYLYNNFQSSTEYNLFLEMIKTRSIYNFEVDITTKDKIITLSTCYNNKEKLVLHAKLIKQQKRY